MAAKRILAVENDELVLSFLESGLSMAGYDVDTAHNGREALEKLDGGGYDLVISDVWMPEMDGFGLRRALEEQGAAILDHFIFLTTTDCFDMYHTALTECRVPSLTKPVTLDDLHSAVEELIQPRR